MKDGGPAFPRVVYDDPAVPFLTGEEEAEENRGMSLLDFFAAHSLSGMNANPNKDILISIAEIAKRDGLTMREALAEQAYLDGVAMLKIREKFN